MNLTLCLAIFSAVLILLLVAVSRICRKTQEENNELKEELEKQKATVVELYNHAEELAQIRQDKSDVNKKINEAKTSEEINAIISGLIHINNDRMRK